MNRVLIEVPPERASLPWREEPSMVGAAAERSPRAGTPWWLWPHLLSLDAPFVALVWQRWWAHAAGVTLPPSREIILGLGVWLIYLVDRLADTRAEPGDRHGTARHIFAGARRKFLQPLTRIIALALVILTPRWLPGAEFRAGLGLLALALGYYWLIHCWPRRGWSAYLPKEAFVGGMFGAGSAFFVFCRSPHVPGAVWPGVTLFAAVCFLNCAYITRWERAPRDLRERSSLPNAFPRLTARLGLVGLGVAALALAVSALTSTPFAVPVAISALLLAALDRCEGSMSADALRVAADLVLLTPSIGLIYWSVAV